MSIVIALLVLLLLLLLLGTLCLSHCCCYFYANGQDCTLIQFSPCYCFHYYVQCVLYCVGVTLSNLDIASIVHVLNSILLYTILFYSIPANFGPSQPCRRNRRRRRRSAFYSIFLFFPPFFPNWRSIDVTPTLRFHTKRTKKILFFPRISLYPSSIFFLEIFCFTNIPGFLISFF